VARIVTTPTVAKGVPLELQSALGAQVEPTGEKGWATAPARDGFSERGPMVSPAAASGNFQPDVPREHQVSATPRRRASQIRLHIACSAMGASDSQATVK
jgi:hypothetical protein